MDATTNPSLIYKAAQIEEYELLIEEAIAFGKTVSSDKKGQILECLDKLSVNFGKDILNVVPGRVSTELDARLSFDIEGSIEKAKKLNQSKSKDMDMDIDRVSLAENSFRWMHNEDGMATEKLAEGICTFSIDLVKLEDLMEKRMND